MSEINKASAPKAQNEGVYHLQLKKGDVPGYVLLPGAPERCPKIASHWDEGAREVASYREYKTIVGTYKGAPIACTSTGIGGPSSEIAVHELAFWACTPGSGLAAPAASSRNLTLTILSFRSRACARTGRRSPMSRRSIPPTRTFTLRSH